MVVARMLVPLVVQRVAKAIRFHSPLALSRLTALDRMAKHRNNED